MIIEMISSKKTEFTELPAKCYRVDTCSLEGWVPIPLQEDNQQVFWLDLLNIFRLYCSTSRNFIGDILNITYLEFFQYTVDGSDIYKLSNVKWVFTMCTDGSL